MDDDFKIPTRKNFLGNKPKSQSYIGLGKKELSKLRGFMSFRGLPSHSSSRVLEDGTIIEVKQCYGLSEITITTIPSELAAKFGQYCLCLPHFTIGIVIEIGPKEVTPDEMLSQRFTYKMILCVKNRYVLVTNVYDANFGRYNRGDIVIVTLANGMDDWEEPYDCSRRCLMAQPLFSYLAISPIIIIGKMSKWIDVNAKL